jgi:hypothetical protein
LPTSDVFGTLARVFITGREFVMTVNPFRLQANVGEE